MLNGVILHASIRDLTEMAVEPSFIHIQLVTLDSW